MRGEPVDRPPVSFNGTGGFTVEPDDPDPYNLYNAPGRQPPLRLAEEHTDLIRMLSPVRARSVDPTGSATGASCWWSPRTRCAPSPRGARGFGDVRARHGRQLVLFGHLEISDIEWLSPDQFADKVRHALAKGTSGTGHGFVLQPSASPYGRTISARTMTNYERMVRLVEAW